MTNPNRTPASGEATTTCKSTEYQQEQHKTAGEAARLTDEAKTWISQVCIAAHRRSPAQTKVAVEVLEAFIDKLAGLTPQPAQGVQAAGDAVAQPDGHLHDDGYFTWAPGKRPPFESHYAGWHVPFFLAAPTVADRVPLTPEQANNVWRRWTSECRVHCDWLSLLRATEAAHGIGAEKTGAQE